MENITELVRRRRSARTFDVPLAERIGDRHEIQT